MVATDIDEWRTAVVSDDDSFNAGFDPAVEVDKRLVIKVDPGRSVRITDLPPVRQDWLQTQFQKGWLLGWISKARFSYVPLVRNLTRDKLREYGRGLILQNIDAHLEQYCPEIKDTSS